MAPRERLQRVQQRMQASHYMAPLLFGGFRLMHPSAAAARRRRALLLQVAASSSRHRRHAFRQEQKDAQQGAQDQAAQAGSAQNLQRAARGPGALRSRGRLTSHVASGWCRGLTSHPTAHAPQVWEDVRKAEGVHDGKFGPLGTTDK